jgi:hypothetical protein
VSARAPRGRGGALPVRAGRAVRHQGASRAGSLPAHPHGGSERAPPAGLRDGFRRGSVLLHFGLGQVPAIARDIGPTRGALKDGLAPLVLQRGGRPRVWRTCRRHGTVPSSDSSRLLVSSAPHPGRTSPCLGSPAGGSRRPARVSGAPPPPVSGVCAVQGGGGAYDAMAIRRGLAASDLGRRSSRMPS